MRIRVLDAVLRFIKTNNATNPIESAPLPGAEFRLYTYPAPGVYIPGTNAVSGSDGLVEINLPDGWDIPGTRFILREIAPSGFVQPEGYWIVMPIIEGGQVTFEFERVLGPGEVVGDPDITPEFEYRVSRGDNIVRDAVPPAETPMSGFTVGLVNMDGSSYVPPTNTYYELSSGGIPVFYFVTGDPAYASQSGQIRLVVRPEDTYNAIIIYSARTTETLPNGGTIQDVSPLPTTYFSRLANAANARANATFFFDAGNFIDIDFFDTNNLSGNNTSIVGLGRGANGEPLTTIFKRAEPTTQRMTRWRFNTPNNYVENVILDGSSINMMPQNRQGNGNTFGTSGNDRGQYFVVVGVGGGPESGYGVSGLDASDLVFRDVIIQNVGSQNTNAGGLLQGLAGNQRNVALNILRVTDGQRNFESLIIRNVMTTSGFGVIQFNQTQNDYFYNLNLINRNATDSGYAQHANAYPIKIEHNITQPEIDRWLGGYIDNQRYIVFDGTLSVPSRNSTFDAVYIQDYRYRNILVPSNFSWALLRIENGGYNHPAVLVFNNKRSAMTLNAPAPARPYIPLQLDTSYWFVEANPFHQNNPPTPAPPNLQAQLNNVNTVINYINNPSSVINTQNTNSRAYIPGPNIKMIANNDRELGGFIIPNFLAAANIAALMQTQTPATTLYPAGAHASGGIGQEFVPYIGGAGNIVFSALGSGHQIFNFDFKTPAEWTIEYAVAGAIINFEVANSGRNLYLLEVTTWYVGNRLGPDQPEVRITKTADEDQVYVGDYIIYTIVATNDGPGTAYNVVVTDVLPTGITFVSTTKPGAVYNPVNNTLTAMIGNMAVNETVMFTVTVRADAVGTVINTAIVSGDNFPDSYDTETVVVNPSHLEPIVDITKVSSADPVFVGENIVYTITVTNVGTAVATNVAVADVLPAGVEFVSTTGPGAVYDPINNTLTVIIAELAISEVLSFTVTVLAVEAGTAINRVIVTVEGVEHGYDEETVIIELPCRIDCCLIILLLLMMRCRPKKKCNRIQCST